MSGGPNYESVAELKMFSMLGVDCVGMSSIPECLTAHHCGNTFSLFFYKMGIGVFVFNNFFPKLALEWQYCEKCVRQRGEEQQI